MAGRLYPVSRLSMGCCVLISMASNNFNSLNFYVHITSFFSNQKITQMQMAKEVEPSKGNKDKGTKRKYLAVEEPER